MRARNEPEEEPLTTDVVILGGGLAGVACARTLGEEGVSVTLVDRNDYNQFEPLLYQVATSQPPARRTSLGRCARSSPTCPRSTSSSRTLCP
jgi:NADH dehydrogenase FAD-containing subunit